MSSLPTSRFAPLGRVFAVALDGLAGLLAAWRSRRIVARLAGLDDHMLQDMGISRQDVLSVLAEPLYRDPSECLASRAADTRRARRSAAAFSYARALEAENTSWPAEADDTERRAA